jgi:exopolysaccharide biosynthesis polyprenyl glycosylphosphotransferase
VTQRTLRYQTTLLLLVLADVVCALGAYAGAFFLRIYFSVPLTSELLPLTRLSEVNHPLLFLASTQIVLLYFFGFYDLYSFTHRVRLVTNVAAALGVQLLATSALYFFQQDLFFPRSVLVLFWLLNTVGVVSLRLWTRSRLARLHPSQVLLVGTVEDVHTFLTNLPELLHVPTFKVAGLVSVNGRRKGEMEADVPWLGHVDDLPRLLKEIPIDEVIILSAPTWKDSFVTRFVHTPHGGLGQQKERPRVLVVPSVYDILVGRVSSLRLHDVPLVELLKDPHEDLAFFLKEIVDVAIAGALLVLSLPLLLVAAVLVKLTSSGPVLYQQQRVGKQGKEFTMYKLRTMVDRAEERTGPVLASRQDTRVTQIGRILRATRIDEVPQLFNVLNGTMSLVGPRPERPEFAQEFAHTVPGYAERLQVKPGLTGLAQVNGEYHTTPEYKLKYDLAYIYNYSLWLDLRIVTETVKVMLTRRGV